MNMPENYQSEGRVKNEADILSECAKAVRSLIQIRFRAHVLFTLFVFVCE